MEKSVEIVKDWDTLKVGDKITIMTKAIRGVRSAEEWHGKIVDINLNKGGTIKLLQDDGRYFSIDDIKHHVNEIWKVVMVPKFYPNNRGGYRLKNRQATRKARNSRRRSTRRH
jgi:hypothetical protein